MMIELIVEGLEGARHIREVHDPAFFGSQGSRDMNLNTKRMAMQTPAFMLFREIRQAMRRFDAKFLEDFHNLLRPSRVAAGLPCNRVWILCVE